MVIDTTFFTGVYCSRVNRGLESGGECSEGARKLPSIQDAGGRRMSTGMSESKRIDGQNGQKKER